MTFVPGGVVRLFFFGGGQLFTMAAPKVNDKPYKIHNYLLHFLIFDSEI
jgi:hypothetical protein